MSSLATSFKELVDRSGLFTRQRPLPHDTVLRPWPQDDFVLNSFVLWEFARYRFREYISVFSQVLVQRIASQRLPGLSGKPFSPSLLIKDILVHC